MQYGAANDAGSSDTSLQSTSNNTLILTNTAAASRALLVQQQSATTAAPAVAIATQGDGESIQLSNSKIGSLANMLHVDGGLRGLYIQDSHYGILIQNPVGHAIEVQGGSSSVLFASYSGATIDITNTDPVSGDPAVTASSQTGDGIHGSSATTGKFGVVGSGVGGGVSGIANGGDPGVRGQSDQGPGISGTSAQGRGGQFSSDTVAQLRMLPSSGTTHPSSGKRGDLFVDKGGRLWFCKGNTHWKQLA
jgi:hypothetical protein